MAHYDYEVGKEITKDCMDYWDRRDAEDRKELLRNRQTTHKCGYCKKKFTDKIKAQKHVDNCPMLDGKY